MGSLRSLVVIALATLGIAAGAAEGARGVVAVAYDGIPQQVHPVAIRAIDGKQEPTPYRDTHYLAPGKHTLRLSPVFGDAANLQRGNTGRRDASADEIVIEVEAGKRYLIGAKLEGRQASEWKPVVLRVEDIGS